MSDLMLTAHSRVGASSASRWMECAGSVALIDYLGNPQEDTLFSAEGNVAHAGAARCLEKGLDAWEIIGTMFTSGSYQLKFKGDMAADVQTYLDHCRSLMHAVNYTIEERISLTVIHPDAFGTADFTAVVDIAGGGTELHVVDYKHGVGVFVEAVDNDQARYYALGVYYSLGPVTQREITTVVLTIVQPRHWRGDPPVRSWSIPLQDLLDWGGDVLAPAIEATQEPDAPLVPGDHCQFCPAKANCPALEGNMEDVMESMDMTADPTGLEDWELAALLDRAAGVRSFLKALENEAYSRVSKGDAVPGWKLVEKKSNRIWKSGAETALLDLFGEDSLSEPVLKSPAQIEKLPGGKEAATLHAYKPHAGTTIAPVSDKRQEVKPRDIKEAFADTPAKE